MYKKIRKLGKAKKLQKARQRKEAKQRKKARRLQEAERLRRLNFKRPTQPPSCHIIALPTEIRLLIWEYLCTVPLPVVRSHNSRPICSPFAYYIRHRHRYPNSRRSVLSVFNIARACYTIYTEVSSLFYDRNMLLQPLSEHKRLAANLPPLVPPPRITRITRISTTVSEPPYRSPLSMSRESIWVPICRAATLVEKVYPMLVEFCVTIKLQPHCHNVFIGERTLHRFEPFGAWHALLRRGTRESRAARVERLKGWFLDMQRYVLRPPSRKMKVLFQVCCGLVDPEAFQTAMEAHCDERGERRRQREAKLQLMSQS